ncbi:MAG: hypothetical protein ACFB15_24185 [Cyclobacteriaceae bacterium]
MTTALYDRSAVSHLLDLLVSDQANVYWCQRGAYTNRLGQTILEIIVYEGNYRKIKGILVYNTHTGKMINLHYRDYLKPINDEADIINTLLDLVNFERSRKLAYA